MSTNTPWQTRPFPRYFLLDDNSTSMMPANDRTKSWIGQITSNGTRIVAEIIDGTLHPDPPASFPPIDPANPPLVPICCATEISAVACIHSYKAFSNAQLILFTGQRPFS